MSHTHTQECYSATKKSETMPYAATGMRLSNRVKVRKKSERESEVAPSCPTLCDPVDCSPPGSSVHGILQARILEWVAISFSRGSSRPRDRTQVSHIAGRHFNFSSTREALKYKNTVSQKTSYRDTELQI